MQTNQLLKTILLTPCLLTLSFMMPDAKAVTMTELMATNDIPAPVVYGTNDPSIQVIVPFLPKDLKPGEKRPAIVLIHGGAWHAPGASMFYPMAKYFASRGIAAFSIDYRSVEKPHFASVGDILEDCRNAMRYIRTHAAEYGVDPDKIAVLGDSAGGHLAAALGTIPDPTEAVRSSADAMIPCNPIVDMSGTNWIKFVMGGKALERKPAPEDLIPTPAQQKMAHDLSPINFVTSKSAPTLLMHGVNDTIVLPAQSQQFADVLKKAGVRCDLVLIPEARHAFILPKYTAPESMVVDATCKADLFLASLGYLKGEPTLVVSVPVAWEPVGKPKPKASASPAANPSPAVH